MIPSAIPEPHSPASNQMQPRLGFIEGLRGLTAVYIVLYHCYFIEVTSVNAHKSFAAWKWLAVNWLGFGEEAMPVFIALSGYGLMLSAIKSGGTIRGGLGPFFYRRAKRILLPYYAMLLTAIALFAIVPKMRGMNADLFEGQQSSDLSLGSLFSHFFLIEHARYFWKFTIDPPIWGAAAVWWNNLLFAVILLPAWRRIGSVPTLLAVFVATLVPHYVFHAGDSSSPWFAFIAALGMAAAAASVERPEFSKIRRAGWLSLSAAALSGCLYIGYLRSIARWEYIYAMDILTGCAAACLLIYCARRKSPQSLLGPLNILESKPLMAGGGISYSLCLTHFPVLWLLHTSFVKPLQMEPLAKMALLIALGLPSCLTAAWIFYFIVERETKDLEPPPTP